MQSQSIVLTPSEVLPPDVGTRVAELQRLDDAEGQTRAVTAMLSHARTGLLAAIAAHDLPQIVEFKAKAAAIQEIAKQVRLGKDMQSDAAEFVRRAERGLGVAIREGQERGEILSSGKKNFYGGGHSGNLKKQLNDELKPGPTDFAKAHELSGANRPGEGIYAMTDGVSDEQFEDALAEAREEGNLSRANVARKAKAKAEELGGDLTASDIVRLAREVPQVAGRRHAEVVAEKFGISKRTYERIKQVVDASESETADEADREYAAWLVADLDAKRITPDAAVKKLADARTLDNDLAPNPATAPRPFKKSDTEMLAEIAGTLDDFAQIITWVRADRIQRDDADELTQRARKAIRAINSKLKEISK